jgi:hypothetical protein
MSIPVCRTVEEAYQAGIRDALLKPEATPELAERIASMLAPWLETLAASRGLRLLSVAHASEQLALGPLGPGAQLVPLPGGVRANPVDPGGVGGGLGTLARWRPRGGQGARRARGPLRLGGARLPGRAAARWQAYSLPDVDVVPPFTASVILTESRAV